MTDRNERKAASYRAIALKEELRRQKKKVSAILRKTQTDWTEEEKCVVESCPELVGTLRKQASIRAKQKQRKEEVEDTETELERKCHVLAEAIKHAKYPVVYTGAGISTSASIPDYRGPNGVWTLLQRGEQLNAVDLGQAEPTFSHMALTALYRQGLVRYLVSQNCDGLHLRSGWPRTAMSEVHGNMFLEICPACPSPGGHYLRNFDVTERTALRRHETARSCHLCGATLKDTIVHFGEKGSLRAPQHWKRAGAAAKKTDLILCLGTSLKVLRRYGCLWSSHKPAKERPKLYIVNLQWTPKDSQAKLKINGRCDDVLQLVLKHLDIEVNAYQKKCDPLLHLYCPLRPEESDSTSKFMIPGLQGTEKEGESSSTTRSGRTKASSHDGVHCCSEACLKTEDRKGKNSGGRKKRKARGKNLVCTKRKLPVGRPRKAVKTGVKTKGEVKATKQGKAGDSDSTETWDSERTLSCYGDETMGDVRDTKEGKSLVEDVVGKTVDEDVVNRVTGDAGRSSRDAVISRSSDNDQAESFSSAKHSFPPLTIKTEGNLAASSFDAGILHGSPKSALKREHSYSGTSHTDNNLDTKPDYKRSWSSQETGASPVTPTTLTSPGWFGKGLKMPKPKKRRKKSN